MPIRPRHCRRSETTAAIVTAAATVLTVAVGGLGGLSRVGADVVEYDTRPAWAAAVGETATIDFTDLPDGTPVVDQYAAMGLLVEGGATIFESSLFLSDGFGIHCPDGIEFRFITPQRWFALEHAGPLMMGLYLGDELVHTTALYVPLEPGAFSGVVSDEPFDRVALFAPVPFNPNLYLDNLHFGGALPAPGAALPLLLLLRLGAAARQRKPPERRERAPVLRHQGTRASILPFRGLL